MELDRNVGCDANGLSKPKSVTGSGVVSKTDPKWGGWKVAALGFDAAAEFKISDLGGEFVSDWDDGVS